jgi:hypothetical protein
MKVNLMVSRRELSHIDTLDLYASRLRKTFIKEAAAELYVEEAVIKAELGRLLLELETRQEALIREKLSETKPKPPLMTDAERQDALELLRDPQLIERILADYDACGLVGEETNKLICYLACVSRRLPQPLAVLVQSGSAAGKTSLVEATLAFMPAEEQVRLSALTAQSLYYMGRTELKHKPGACFARRACKRRRDEAPVSFARSEKAVLVGPRNHGRRAHASQANEEPARGVPGRHASNADRHR